MGDPPPVPVPPLSADVADLIAGTTERTVLKEVPGKSGARLERVVIAGQPYVLKHLDIAEDWTMRGTPGSASSSTTPWPCCRNIPATRCG